MMSWKHRPAALVTALLAGLSPVQAAEVTVFAAASLADALREVAAGVDAAAGHRPLFNFGASNDLARQIAKGAAADVFFSADPAQVDRLERASLVRRADRVEVLSNTLVVIVPARSARRFRSPADLASLERLALANPEAVPAGVYARTWLESLGLWAALRDRIVPTLDVRGALAAVASEHVDGGIVYRTDAALSSRVRVAFEVPRQAGARIVYVLAPLAEASAAGRAFARELTSPRAAKVYEKHGFIVLTSR